MKIISFVQIRRAAQANRMLAINLAVAAERAGEKVCVVDLDPQGTIGNWYNTRTSETPLVIAPGAVIHLNLDGSDRPAQRLRASRSW